MARTGRRSADETLLVALACGATVETAMRLRAWFQQSEKANQANQGAPPAHLFGAAFWVRADYEFRRTAIALLCQTRYFRKTLIFFPTSWQ
jgi:hypothetical protein